MDLFLKKSSVFEDLAFAHFKIVSLEVVEAISGDKYFLNEHFQCPCHFNFYQQSQLQKVDSGVWGKERCKTTYCRYIIYCQRFG